MNHKYMPSWVPASDTEYHSKMMGATGLSYVPVVAGGDNALILHYVVNNKPLRLSRSNCRAGDLLLVDAGAEYGGYASDITRTWPVSGTFTEPQRMIYEIVLSAQKQVIDRSVTGSSLDTLQDEVFELMRDSLSKLFKRRINNMVQST
jgi:Xaa-Pro aminopeptidase